jgi:hypothetical protein
LTQAAELPVGVLCKLAHALGWPHPNAFAQLRAGRVRWANPTRNTFAAEEADRDCLRAEAAGWADKVSEPAPGLNPYVYWRVTDLGRQVVRLRLESMQRAAQLRADGVAPVPAGRPHGPVVVHELPHVPVGPDLGEHVVSVRVGGHRVDLYFRTEGEHIGTVAIAVGDQVFQLGGIEQGDAWLKLLKTVGARLSSLELRLPAECEDTDALTLRRFRALLSLFHVQAANIQGVLVALDGLTRSEVNDQLQRLLDAQIPTLRDAAYHTKPPQLDRETELLRKLPELHDALQAVRAADHWSEVEPELATLSVDLDLDFAWVAVKRLDAPDQGEEVAHG